MNIQLFLKKIFLQSLVPFEISEFSKINECFFNKKDQAEFLDIWKKTISRDGSSKIFEQYAEYYQLSESEIHEMVASLEDCEGRINFPVWVNALEQILSEINIAHIDFFERENPFYQMISPFVNFFSSRLKLGLDNLNLQLPKKAVFDQLKIALYKDLLEKANLVLLKEFSEFMRSENNNNINNREEDFFYKKFVTKNLSDKFNSLFLKYPMLARKLASKTQNYLEFVTEMFKRFYKDKAEIAYTFNTTLTELSQLHLNVGDQHNGASTVIFEFEDSYKLVYKPTSVTVTFAYNQFLEWVNDHLDEQLKSFDAIDKQQYGWLEFVKSKPCNDLCEIKLYYERAGVLLGIAYFLNAKDYHFENVIASGDCPVLIDHETTIGPNIKKISARVNFEDPNKMIVGTILESLLLPSGIRNIPLHVSGFGSSVQLGRNHVVPRIKHCNTDKMRRTPELVFNKLYKLNKPRFNNKVKNLVDYQFEFINGFNRLYKLIIENKNLLLSRKSPLVHFQDIKVRFMNRSTIIYFKLLKKLNSPEYLKSAVLYGLKLELLARAYSATGKWSPVLDLERKQMCEGDIPVFYTNTLSDQLVLLNGQKIDLFEDSSFESIMNKIRNADLQDYQSQLDIMENVLAL